MEIFEFFIIIVVWILMGVVGKSLIHFSLGIDMPFDTTFFCGFCNETIKKYTVLTLFCGPISLFVGVIFLFMTSVLRPFLVGRSCIIGSRLSGTTCYKIKKRKQEKIR